MEGNFSGGWGLSEDGGDEGRGGGRKEETMVGREGDKETCHLMVG